MTQIKIVYEGSLRTHSVYEGGQQEIVTDASQEKMFSPTDLLAAALGSCVLTLMGIAAERLKVDVTGLRLTLDKEMAKTPSRRMGRIVMHIYCPRSFDPDVQQKLETAGSHCPVHQSLHPDVKQEFFFHWGEP